MSDYASSEEILATLEHLRARAERAEAELATLQRKLDIRKAWDMEAEAGIERLKLAFGCKGWPPDHTMTVGDKFNFLCREADHAIATARKVIGRAERAERQRDELVPACWALLDRMTDGRDEADSATLEEWSRDLRAALAACRKDGT